MLGLDGATDPAKAAAAYEAKLKGCAALAPGSAGGPPGLPRLDLVLLGLGEDAHVASLFPNAPELQEPASGRWVLPITASPKPPAGRVTLSMAAINAAAAVVFVASGPGKARPVQLVLEVQALPGALPAQLVRPVAGSVRWLLDGAAAGALRPALWDQPAFWPRSEVPALPKK